MPLPRLTGHGSMVTGDWRVDVLIAFIGAIGLIVPGWLTYKGATVGKDPRPAIESHGTVAWEAAQNRRLVSSEASRVRDFVAHEHDETRRQMREAIRDMAQQHEETRRQIREHASGTMSDQLLAAIAKLKFDQ